MNIINEEFKLNLKSYFKEPYNIIEIINYIDEIDTIYEYTYKNIKAIVYYRKNKDDIDFNFIKRVINRGTNIIKNKSFTIILLLTPAKKIIEYNKILKPKNCNSGFTFINSNKIFIFRKEEFPKIIIHELLHHDDNIHNDDFNNENKLKLYNFFNLHPNTKLILNEAIIEFWTTLIHLSFISNEYNINYDILLQKEIEYSLFKYSQIINLRKKQSNKLWYDECNIYSYIIFKTIFLYYFKEFFKIYTFPYNDTKITDFIIKYSKVKIIKKNPLFKLNKNKIIQRDINSLCFMLFSDL